MWPEQSGASRVVAFMGTRLCPGGSGALLAASLRAGGGLWGCAPQEPHLSAWAPAIRLLLPFSCTCCRLP